MTIRTPSAAAVLPLGDLPTYERGGGARTTPLFQRAVGTTRFITGYTDFDTGTRIPLRSHDCEESVVLIAGDAMLDIDGQEYRPRPLDCTYIPPNVPHRFRNLSTSRSMRTPWPT